MQSRHQWGITALVMADCFPKKWLKAQFLKLQSDEVMALSPLSMFPFSFSASTGKVYAVYGLLHGFGALSFLSPAKLRHKGRVALWECRVWGVSSPLNARQSDLATSRKRLTCMLLKQQQSTASSLRRNINHTCSLFTFTTIYIYIYSQLDCACTQKRLRVRFYTWFIYRAVVAVSIALKSKPCIKRHSYDSWRGLGHWDLTGLKAGTGLDCAPLCLGSAVDCCPFQFWLKKRQVSGEQE